MIAEPIAVKDNNMISFHNALKVLSKRLFWIFFMDFKFFVFLLLVLFRSG